MDDMTFEDMRKTLEEHIRNLLPNGTYRLESALKFLQELAYDWSQEPEKKYTVQEMYAYLHAIHVFANGGSLS